MMAKGPLTEVQAVELGVDLCEALHHIHSSNLVHRDIKPANIIASVEGRFKLIDLGLVRMEQAVSSSVPAASNEAQQHKFQSNPFQSTPFWSKMKDCLVKMQFSRRRCQS